MKMFMKISQCDCCLLIRYINTNTQYSFGLLFSLSPPMCRLNSCRKVKYRCANQSGIHILRTNSIYSLNKQLISHYRPLTSYAYYSQKQKQKHIHSLTHIVIDLSTIFIHPLDFIFTHMRNMKCAHDCTEIVLFTRPHGKFYLKSNTHTHTHIRSK